MGSEQSSAAALMGAYQPQRPARLQSLSVRGGQIVVTRWGEAARPPVVLLHGWMDCAASYQFLADCLPADWSLAGLDWRGYGHSEPRADHYYLPDNIADLEAVLALLCPHGRVGIIAHSLGGTVASMYAGIRPERVSWLVNLEGFGLWRGPQLAQERLARWLDEQAQLSQRARYASLDAFARRILMRHPRLRPDRARFLAAAWTRARDGMFEISADPKHQLLQPLRVRQEDVEQCWSRMRCPLLMLYGSESDALARVGADPVLQHWRELMPHMQLLRIDGAGHMLHHEQPEQVAAQIERFVSALEH